MYNFMKMNPFEPTNLSPLSNVQTACDLPYHLTWEDLLPILPGFDAQRLNRAQAFTSHEKQGLNGGYNSCILTLQYPLEGDAFQALTVFIKSQSDPHKEEAQRYRFLSSQGVPTPRLLGVLRKGTAEIIILEFLATIGIDFRSIDEVNALLQLAAQVNALPHSKELFTPPAGMPQAEFDEFVRGALNAIALDPSLPEIDAPRWFEAYQIAQVATQSMTLAVNHNEFFFQQTGWSEEDDTRQLVIFDLETMALRPRFTDIATVLYPLSVYSGRGQGELFQIYLTALEQHTKQKLEFGEAVRELRLLRITEMCYSIPWLVAEVKKGENITMQESLAMSAACLRDDLSALDFS
jgi:hypothetical protein